ncbi:hypothetical protein TorRG33x02_288820 [Trema orientale]|uniref:Retrotransposon gag domain-containing protein n=1 Tax=Trema orientale TaxID=63057 RepID=A0A2P5CDT8_TREOI|nr:hypothetical protein TorRG33x02_288820 [Trema orientale]
MPNISQYNGKGDPAHHVQNYKAWMTIAKADPGESESLRSYLTRFDAAVLECLGVTQETILNAAQEGIRHEKLVWFMSKTRLTTYAVFEEYFLTRVKEGTITSMVGTSEESRKRVKAEGGTNEPQPKKSKQDTLPPSNSLQHPRMNNLRSLLPSQNKAIVPKQNYIPLNTTRE